MINPDKAESRLSSKIFKLLTLYMIIALCTFFGFIMLYEPKSPTTESSGVQSDPFTQLVNNFMATKTASLSLELDVESDDLIAVFSGDILVDIQKQDFSADINFVYNDKLFDISVLKNSNILGSENMVFVNVNESGFKINLDEVNPNLFDIISKMNFDDLGLNINIDRFIEALERYTGFDFSDENLLDNLLKKVTETVPTETENGFTFDIAFNSIRVLLNCDKNFNNLTAQVDLPPFEDYYLDLKINSVVLNDEKFEITSLPTGKEEDITSILNIIDNAQLEDNKYALSSDFEAKVDDLEVLGDVFASVVKKGEEFVPYVRMKTSYDGANVYLYLLDKTVYLNVENLMFKFDINEVNIEEIKTLLKKFDVVLDETQLSTIAVILPTLSEISANWLENGLSFGVNGDIEVEKVKLSNIAIDILFKEIEENILPDEITLSGDLLAEEMNKTLTLTLKNIELGKRVNNVDDIKFGGENFEQVESIKVNSGNVELGEFVDLGNFLRVAQTIADAKNLTLSIDTEILTESLKMMLLGEVKFDIASKSVIFEGTANIDGLVVSDFALFMENVESGEIYLTLGGKTIKLDINKDNIQKVLAEFGLSFEMSVGLEDILQKIGVTYYSDNLVKTIIENLKDIHLTQVGDKFELTFKNYRITFGFDTEKNNFFNIAVTPFSFENIEVEKLNITNLVINDENFEIIKPNEFEDVTSLLDLVENAKLDENTYAISGDLAVSYNEMSFAGNMLAMVVTSGEKFVPYIRLNAEVEGVNAYIYLLDQTIYLNVDNLKFKFDLTQENIDEVMNFVESELGISLGLDEEAVATITYVLPALENISASWIENGFNIKVDDEIQIENVRLYNIIVEVLTKKDAEENILPDSLKLETNIDFGEGENKVALNITNIEIGKNADYLEDITINEGIVESVRVENGTAKLSEFIDLMPALDIAKVVMNVNNLTGYIDTKVLSDKTEISLNGEVKFDIQTMSMSANLTAEYDGLVVDFGLYLENLTNLKEIYLTLGEKTLKLDLEKANLEELLGSTGMNEDVSEIISTILEKLNINLDLENLDIKALVLEILQGLTVEESEDRLTLNVKYQGYEVKVEVLKGSYSVYNLEISPITIDNISITKLNLTNVEVNANNFALDTPNFEEVEDVTSLLDLVENAKLDENTYAISGDLKVRYSTTSFYGNILAMLTMKEGKLVPYVRVYTTSMNLSTFIYLIDTTVYIDLQGLRIKADLNETTINEILDFVNSEFLTQEEQIPEETTESFEIILPALKNISANWILNEDNLSGIQVNVDDELYYTANAYFDSIVLQAFGVKGADGTILPTEIVLGANINDPNTTIYDDYEDYLLENETAVTSSKNFAVYLENVEIGKNANYQDSIVFDEVSGIVTSLMGNAKNENNFYTLEEFNDYSVLLESFKVVKDYIFSYQYQINLNASLGETAISGDINVDVTDAEETEARDDIFELFGGKNLQVQGDLSLVMSGVRHLISILYDSDERDASGQFNENYGGLYITYSHGEYISSGDAFRGRIDNLNMSDMISFILGFLNIELGEETMESWNLEKSTTDFSFVHSILGIGQNDVSGDISQVDEILTDTAKMLEMLENIELRKTEENGLDKTELEISLKINETIGSVVITLNEERVNDEIVNKLRKIQVSNINLGEDILNATITIEDFDSANFDYFASNPAEKHFDLSNFPEFMDTAINTLNTKNFTYKGKIGVNIPLGNVDLSIDLHASIENLDNPYIYAQVSIGSGGIASMMFEGDFDTRMVTYEFKDGILTFHRYSIKSRTHTTWTDWIGKKWTEVKEDVTASYQSNEIMGNIVSIIMNSMGIKEEIPLLGNTIDIITSIMEMLDINPSLERSILGFSANETLDKMTLSLDMEDITGIDGAGTSNITLAIKNYQQSDGTSRKFGFIESFEDFEISLPIITELTKMTLTFDLYSKESDWGENTLEYNTASYILKSSYEDNSGNVVGGKKLYTNEYYRQKYMETQVA